MKKLTLEDINRLNKEFWEKENKILDELTARYSVEVEEAGIHAAQCIEDGQVKNPKRLEITAMIPSVIMGKIEKRLSDQQEQRGKKLKPKSDKAKEKTHKWVTIHIMKRWINGRLEPQLMGFIETDHGEELIIKMVGFEKYSVETVGLDEKIFSFKTLCNWFNEAKNFN